MKEVRMFTRRLSASLGLLIAAVAAVAAAGAGAPATAAVASPAAAGCQLQSAKGAIKHVIVIQFDNTHLARDNPNVKSDLEQMPHLLNFLKNNGTVSNKHYTVLISHTAGGILSSLTGLYPDRMGATVTNSYDYYNPATGKATFTSAFKYWTAPVAGGIDDLPNMVNGDSGTPKMAPAPWVSYTRAGCDVGNVSVANTVLENNSAILTPPTTLAAAAAAGATNIKVASIAPFRLGLTVQLENGEFVGPITDVGTAGALGTGITLGGALTQAHPSGAPVQAVDPTGDMTTIFGKGSPEWGEGKASQLAPSGTAARALAQTDFVGIAVHCSKDPSSMCKNTWGSPNAKADPLPDESGGYNGYQALFGAKYVNPAITSGSAAVKDVYNSADITDGFGQKGFPGFDGMSASTTLGYVAQMQEAGIPITYGYISDVHDNHAGGGAYGPGEKPYVDALKSYDDAFAAFFDRLAKDGINKNNTLFVFTADENDHFAGEQAQGCDGETTYCVYNTVATNPKHGIFDVSTGGATPFAKPSPWPPLAKNGPFVGEVGYNIKWAGLLGTTISGTGYDISFDSAPSFYIDNQPQALDGSGNVIVNSTLRAFEKKAGELQGFDPYVDDTQLTPVAKYLVDGPTLRALHMLNADPQRTMSFTMFALPDYFFQTFSPCPAPSQGCLNSSFAWIHGDYSNDIGQTWLGMAGPGVRNGGLDDETWSDHVDIVPTIMALLGLKTDYVPDGRVLTEMLSPSAAKGGNSKSFEELGAIYKQLDAPYGDFAHSLIVASTTGIKADDAAYVATENAINALTAERDALTLEMRDVLTGASNGHQEQLIKRGQDLLEQAKALTS